MKSQLLAILRMIVVIFTMTSCVTPNRCHEKYPCAQGADTIRIDSLIYQQSVKIDTIVIPSDSSMLEMLFGCDSLNQVYIKALTDKSSMGVITRWQFKDNTLFYQTKRDSLEKIIYTLQTKIKEYSKIQITQKPSTIEVNSKFAVFAIWVFWIGIGVLAIGLGLKFKVWRLFTKPIA